jgi:fructoselysine-6-P-deglycase FrlB-like protein
MTIFIEKLSRLVETIAMVRDRGVDDLAQVLTQGRGRIAIAIGSGGSAVTAHFFARCRTTLGLGYTLVMTPMEFVMAMDEWADADIWLFSAGASNPDIAAAFRTAAASRCHRIQLMTTRSDGATAVGAANHPRVDIHLMPVADPKDGFLATHSMIAMVAGLLMASDALTESPQGRRTAEYLENRATELLSQPAEEAAGGFQPGDTVIVLHDPQVAAVAVLIETSLWETGIAPIQRTDFRNFAHGRHVWAARHPETMYALALTTRETEGSWHPIMAAMPRGIRRGAIDLGHGGRMANAIGIVHGLAVIARLGELAGIDPGKPGRGPFAEAIYDNPSLNELAGQLTHPVRHKAAARLLHDPLEEGGISICEIGSNRLRDLAKTHFVGVVLDYDGTVVPNQPIEARLGAPNKDVMDELVRLVDSGVQVGFATGRGKSAGIRLREALPTRIHRNILIGYYNGAHVRTLDVDIRQDRPEAHAGIADFSRWLLAAGLLRDGASPDVGLVQMAIDHAEVVDPARFLEQVAQCPQIMDKSLEVRRSHHSFDIVPRDTSKRRVAKALAERAGEPTGLVIGIGDSGSPIGNDYELLCVHHGFSVGSVCGSYEGTWTIFGSRLSGPDATARILQAMRIEDHLISIDVEALQLDEA